MKTRVVVAVSIAIAGAVAALLRFYVVEPEGVAHLCSAPDAPWWCAPRAAVIAAFTTNALAVAALAASSRDRPAHASASTLASVSRQTITGAQAASTAASTRSSRPPDAARAAGSLSHASAAKPAA